MRYYFWLEKKWNNGSMTIKIFLFFLAPQIIASIVTGLTFKQLWQGRHNEDSKFRAHIIRNILLWSAAMIWFWGFWLILFPAGSYILYTYVA